MSIPRGDRVNDMSSSRCFSVFVRNLSPKVNWRHLKKLFQRFGQVLDVFIPKKTNVSGSKFGFIRFSTLREAETTVYMFGGAWVVDRRIRVNLVRYRSRSNYWRRKHSHGLPQEKVHQNDNKFDNVPATGKTGEGGYPKEADVESSSKLQGMSLDEKPVAEAKTHKETSRRIHGHVEEESLWKLSKSLIGTMALDCNTEEVKRRLHNWGLGDFVVKKMGGRRFLIESIDDELLNLMEKQQWSLLKEIFLEVCYWSETFKILDRTTWVEVVGIPLHCWNYLTFKRIAECWGSLVALVSSSVQCSCPGKKPDRKSSSKTSVNSSESSTTSNQKEKSESSGDNPIGIDEAINAICLGKSSHDYANSADKGAFRSLGVPELVGGRFEALSGDNVSAGSSLRENGVVSSKNICVDCSVTSQNRPSRDWFRLSR
ncbi:hypothetical protein V6N13_127188 [Hibiscus sabdariffa]